MKLSNNIHDMSIDDIHDLIRLCEKTLRELYKTPELVYSLMQEIYDRRLLEGADRVRLEEIFSIVLNTTKAEAVQLQELLDTLHQARILLMGGVPPLGATLAFPGGCEEED